MTYRVTMETEASPNGTAYATDASALVDCLVAQNENYLRRVVGRDFGSNPAVPLLANANARRAVEPFGHFFWRTIPLVIEKGGDDVEILAWVIAERRVRFGEDVRPTMVPTLPALGGTVKVTLERHAFNGSEDAQESIEDLASMLDCLNAMNAGFFRRTVGQDYGRNTAVPLIYASGVRYAEEPVGAEFWRTVPIVLRYGEADCEDLSSWLVEEKRVRFGLKDARAIIIPQFREPTVVRPKGSYLYHIQGWSPDVPGGVDDPSRRMGMT